jgi:GNAT superfamily N-acetyltransferase
MTRPSAKLEAITIVPIRGHTARKEQWNEVLRDGRNVLIRPIRNQDATLERGFIKRLSPRSRRLLFLSTMSSPSNALLKLLVDIDPAREVALIALTGEGAQEQEIGVARLSADADARACEFAITVGDEWRRNGLGSVLMQRLIAEAVARGLESMHTIGSAGNDGLREFAGHHGFLRQSDPNDATRMLYTLDLGKKGSAAV